MCIRVRAYAHGYFPDGAVSRRLHANGTKAYRWGMRPELGESVPVTCMRHMHTVTYERARSFRAHVCARARTWHAVVPPSVCTVGIMSHRVSRSVTLTCATSVPDDSPTSVHARRLRTTKIRRTAHVYPTDGRTRADERRIFRFPRCISSRSSFSFSRETRKKINARQYVLL